MFILKSLVATLALGLVQDAIAVAAAPACCNDKCGKPVRLAYNGKKDCSAFLIKTVTPTRTTTLFKTKTLSTTKTLYKTITVSGVKTLTGLSTAIEVVTGTTDITLTTIASETDQNVSTSLATVEETETITATATDVETLYETTTVPFVYVSTTTQGPIKKRNAKPTKPAYASACDNGAYIRACSCIGVKPKTTTKPAVVKTVYKTRTAYKTLTASKTVTAYETSTARETKVVTETSQAPPVTQTSVVSLTTYTTIISGTAITATETVTLTESATLTETTVVVATQTADPAPPTCTGKGFSFRVTGTSQPIGNWGVGFINSIGVGIYFRLFSGGASPYVISSQGNLQSWYPSDYQYVIKNSDGLPARVWVASQNSQVSYSWPSTSLTCNIGGAPNYSPYCKSSSTTYMFTFCRDPVYYEWVGTVYTDVSQLAGMMCASDGVVKTSCV